MKSQNGKNQEMHPLFPSGDWEGFYTYQTNAIGNKSPMNFHLDFMAGLVKGSGEDSVGGFSWKGTYSIQEMRCKMIKSYVSHEVFYDGRVDENGIWGIWSIPPFTKGGFHIWPKKTTAKNEVEEKMADKKEAETKLGTRIK